jgi:hypothetical protein
MRWAPLGWVAARSGSPRGWTPSPLRHRRSPDWVSERRWLRGDGFEPYAQRQRMALAAPGSHTDNGGKCYPSCRIDLLPISPVVQG